VKRFCRKKSKKVEGFKGDQEILGLKGYGFRVKEWAIAENTNGFINTFLK
jgi:hypothetical protein